jgi:DNA-binding transcriptional MerR regulator
MGGGSEVTEPVLDAEPSYNLKAVVQRTAIPAASLRAWERRYGIPAPVRKANGHRVYSASEVERLLRMKTLMAQGMSASQAAGQVDQPQTTLPVNGQSEVERLRLDLEGAWNNFDNPAAHRAWGALLALMSVEQMCQQVLRPLLPALAAFGRTCLRTLLGSLLVQAPTAGLGRTALVMAPDPLDLEPILMAVFLSRQGYIVIYVEGTTAPVDLKPDLVIDPRQPGAGLSAFGTFS